MSNREGPRSRPPGKDTRAQTPVEPAAPGVPGRRTRVEEGWNTMLQQLGIPASVARPGTGELVTPYRTAQAQAPGEQLRRIVDEASAITAAINPDGRAGDGLAEKQRTEYLAQLRDLARQTERLAAGIPDPEAAPEARELASQLAAAQDAVLRAHQMLAVYYADQTLQAWSGTSDADHKAQRAAYRRDADGKAGAEWCGMFADAQYRAAGMAGALRMVLNSAFHARQFFSYGTGSANSPQTIVPHGQGAAVALAEYHKARGSLRTWLDRAQIGDDIRPGDVVTLDFLGGDDPNDKATDVQARADHICIVRSYARATGELITIDGNMYGAQKPGAAQPAFHDERAMSPEVSTSRYVRGAAGHNTKQPQNTGPAFERTAMLPKGSKAWDAITLMGRGRFSLVDFEADHRYPDFTRKADTMDRPVNDNVPTGPIQDQVQRSERGGAVHGDPGRAFDAATAGAAGEVPYRAEMEARLGAAFGTVRSFVGRDLTAMNANAATRGETVVFASPSPDKETVAHELTHVLQNRQGRTGGGALSDPGDAAEREARSAASDVAAGRAVSVGAAPSAEIHRDVGKAGYAAAPPAIAPRIADNAPGGGLDWEHPHFHYINRGDMPSSLTMREIFHVYLLRQLVRHIPRYLLEDEPPPPESNDPVAVATRAEYVRRIGGKITARIAALREAHDRTAETLRVQLFTANEYAVVDTLRVAKSGRYAGSASKTFCNVYAYDVVTAMGGYLPRVWWTPKGLTAWESGAELVTEAEFQRRKPKGDNVITNRMPWAEQVNANGLYTWLDTWGSSFGWHRVENAEKAQNAANAGLIVVISAMHQIETSPGHITVVLAETKGEKEHPDKSLVTSKGGEDYVPLQTQAGATNFASNAEHDYAGPPGRTPWWAEKQRYKQAGMWACHGPARDTAIQPPEILGAAQQPRRRIPPT